MKSILRWIKANSKREAEKNYAIRKNELEFKFMILSSMNGLSSYWVSEVERAYKYYLEAYFNYMDHLENEEFFFIVSQHEDVKKRSSFIFNKENKNGKEL